MLRRETRDAEGAADFATALFMGGIRALPHVAQAAPRIDAA